jgi:hypothetical protein
MPALPTIVSQDGGADVGHDAAGYAVSDATQRARRKARLESVEMTEAEREEEFVVSDATRRARRKARLDSWERPVIEPVEQTAVEREEEFVVSEATRRARRKARLESVEMTEVEREEEARCAAAARAARENAAADSAGQGVRAAVHAEYAKLRAQQWVESEATPAGAQEAATERVAVQQAELAVIRDRTSMDEGTAVEHVSAADRVVGQLSFPVAQSVLRKAPRLCRVGVGSMGLALFDGPLPLTTWLYMFMSDVTASTNDEGGELSFSYQYSKRRGKMIRFQTMHAVELCKHIARAQSALEAAVELEEGEPLRRNYMKVDGVSIPFDIPAFAPQQARLSGRRAIGGGIGEEHESSFDAAAVKDSIFVIRRRNKSDFSYVDAIKKAQDAGAEAVVLVNYCSKTDRPVADKWPEGTIQIPVVTLPLTVGGGMLARHGSTDVSFCYGDASCSSSSCTHAEDGGASDAGPASTTTLAGIQEGVPPEPEPEPEPESEPTPENQQGMVWVGGLPESLTAEASLRSVFERFGPVTSVTVRVKEGASKSWALVSFAETISAEAALATDLRDGVNVPVATPLRVERADVGGQLKRSATGALAEVWMAQQQKQEQWLSSLLSELEVDPQYIAAQGAVAADMGLAIEELGEELASQELAFLRNSGHNLSTLDADDADWWTTAAADC